MPIIWTLAEHAVLLARDNDDDSNNRQFQDDDNDSNNHRRLEIGVIVAIVVAGLAVISFTATCIVKRKRRVAKRSAKAGARPITGVEEEWFGTASKTDIEMTDAGEERGAKKVAFVGVGEGEAPPTYQTAILTGDSKGDVK
jgi:hypothetical protein